MLSLTLKIVSIFSAIVDGAIRADKYLTERKLQNEYLKKEMDNSNWPGKPITSKGKENGNQDNAKNASEK
jgi:hypothetical protein